MGTLLIALPSAADKKRIIVATVDISKIALKEIIPGYRARFVHTEQTTLAFWVIDKDAEMPVHSHMHEQTMQVMEGQFSLTVDGKTSVYEPGTLILIPPHVPHGGRALTDCKVMDIFSPVREDYRL